MGVQYGEMEHDLHVFFPECLHQLLDDITVLRAAHDTIIGSLGIPHAESGMVFCREADKLHVGGFSGICPLVAIQFDRIENFG